MPVAAYQPPTVQDGIDFLRSIARQLGQEDDKDSERCISECCDTIEEALPSEVKRLREDLERVTRKCEFYRNSLAHEIANRDEAMRERDDAVKALETVRETENAYYIALGLCLDRYEPMARELERTDLLDFVEEFRRAIASRTPLPKLCRWLGYIQGVLISAGVASVSGERDWTRPLFRPLDFPAPAAGS